jgi:hypothetical protein
LAEAGGASVRGSLDAQGIDDGAIALTQDLAAIAARYPLLRNRF